MFGKSKVEKKAMDPVKSSRPLENKESLDERINHLWESAKELDYSDASRKKQLTIYTELLDIIDEESTSYNICAILRNRAIAYWGSRIRMLQNLEFAP